MLSSQIIHFHDTRLKRFKARRTLIILFITQLLLAFTNWEYLRFKHWYQRYFELNEWLQNQVHACGDNFIGYGNQMVWLKDAQLSPNTKAFVISCDTEIPKYWFDRRTEGTPYTKRLSRLETRQLDQTERHSTSDTKSITFVVERIEAHNLYHTMCEFFNIFLLHKIFRIDLDKSAILFLDSRPKSGMDDVWEVLFNKVIHHEQVQESTRFENIIWIPIGYESPLNRHNLETLQYIDEFKQYFTSKYGINRSKSMDCNRRNYTLILRHDYITHPERLTVHKGTVFRKLANEKDIIQVIKNTIGPKDNLRTVLLETMSLKEQLELFTNTDVLVAAHGAGMTHILFLPDHASVIELRTYNMDKHHFSAMARWRRLNYISFNSDNINDGIYVPEFSFSLKDMSEQIRKVRCYLDSQCAPSNEPC